MLEDVKWFIILVLYFGGWENTGKKFIRFLCECIEGRNDPITDGSDTDSVRKQDSNVLLLCLQQYTVSTDPPDKRCDSSIYNGTLNW